MSCITRGERGVGRKEIWEKRVKREVERTKDWEISWKEERRKRDEERE